MQRQVKGQIAGLLPGSLIHFPTEYFISFLREEEEEEEEDEDEEEEKENELIE